MFAEELHVSFEGPEVGENGVPLDDLHKTFAHLQKAFWLMVSHLEEATTPAGHAPAWIKRGCGFRLMRTSSGSLVAELGVVPLTDARSSVKDSSQKAIDLIMQWQPEDSNSLPAPVAREISCIGKDISPKVALVRLYNPSDERHLYIPRHNQSGLRVDVSYTPAPPKISAESVPAILYGRLMEVDWDKGTARLHRYADRPVTLRFNAAMDEDMHRLARQYVEVRGQGRFNKNDEWVSVQVEKIDKTSSWNEPFNIETFWNNPNPKVFDLERVVTASESFDVDEFIRIIHESRDIGREDSSEW